MSVSHDLRYWITLCESLNDAALMTRLKAAAHEHGSPIEQHNWQSYYPEFERIVQHPNRIRFAASGKAGEFMRSPEAETLVADAGWLITVLHDRSNRRGLNPDGSQHWHHFVEVRLESQAGETPYQMPTELYHVTPSTTVPAILAQGLLPQRPSRPEMHRYPPRIHFATSLKAAQKIEQLFRAYDADHQIERSYALLRVAPEAAQPLYIDQEYHNDGLYTTEPVPPNQIEVMRQTP